MSGGLYQLFKKDYHVVWAALLSQSDKTPDRVNEHCQHISTNQKLSLRISNTLAINFQKVYSKSVHILPLD